MKIKYGSLIADGSGTIGGVTFSRNGSGAYVRTYVKPINPSTVAQQIIRNRMAGLVVAWRGLSDPVRLGFNSISKNFPQTNKMGEVFFLTGQQLFTKFSSNKLAFGESALAGPVKNSTEPVITITAVAIASASAVITIDVAAVPATAETIIRATNGLSAGRSNAFRSQYKQIGEALVAATNDFDIKASYEAVFGSISAMVGQKIFVEVLTCDKASGQVVGKSKAVAVVAA